MIAQRMHFVHDVCKSSRMTGEGTTDPSQEPVLVWNCNLKVKTFIYQSLIHMQSTGILGRISHWFLCSWLVDALKVCFQMRWQPAFTSAQPSMSMYFLTKTTCVDGCFSLQQVPLFISRCLLTAHTCALLKGSFWKQWCHFFPEMFLICCCAMIARILILLLYCELRLN